MPAGPAHKAELSTRNQSTEHPGFCVCCKDEVIVACTGPGDLSPCSGQLENPRIDPPLQVEVDHGAVITVIELSLTEVAKFKKRLE